MLFQIRTAGDYYTKTRAEQLAELGFGFVHDGEAGRLFGAPFAKTRDKVTIEINTLEELMAFEDKWGQLIVSSDHIIIYDDYIE